MKNTLISILLFILLLGFVIYANISLDKLCLNISEKCNTIEILIEEDDLHSAYLESQRILQELKDNSLLTSIYLNHCDFDNINNEAVRLAQYLKYNDISESSAALSQLRFFTDNIKKLQEPTFENIF